RRGTIALRALCARGVSVAATVPLGVARVVGLRRGWRHRILQQFGVSVGWNSFHELRAKGGTWMGTSTQKRRPTTMHSEPCIRQASSGAAHEWRLICVPNDTTTPPRLGRRRNVSRECKSGEEAGRCVRLPTVSHARGSPVSNPFRNQLTRCAEEPWVNESVFT